MAIHAEEVLDDMKLYLQGRLPAQLDALVLPPDNTHLRIALPAPTPENYFIGEPSRYRAYIAPALFIVANRTARPRVLTGGEDANTIYQHHLLLISIMVEGLTEEELTRACFRYAEALNACIHNHDITTAPSTARTWSTLCKVRSIDWGVMFTAEQSGQRIFRKDVALDVVVFHWDLLSPMG